jgi:hypothetical protein
MCCARTIARSFAPRLLVPNGADDCSPSAAPGAAAAERFLREVLQKLLTKCRHDRWERNSRFTSNEMRVPPSHSNLLHRPRGVQMIALHGDLLLCSVSADVDRPMDGCGREKWGERRLGSSGRQEGFSGMIVTRFGAASGRRRKRAQSRCWADDPWAVPSRHYPRPAGGSPTRAAGTRGSALS